MHATWQDDPRTLQQVMHISPQPRFPLHIPGAVHSNGSVIDTNELFHRNIDVKLGNPS